MEIVLPKPSLSVLIKTNCLLSFWSGPNLESAMLNVEGFISSNPLFVFFKVIVIQGIYLKQFNHFIEKNLSCRVGFVMLKKGFEVEFCGNVILYFFSGKSGPNVHYQSTQWVVIIIMSSSNQIQINNQIYQL